MAATDIVDDDGCTREVVTAHEYEQRQLKQMAEKDPFDDIVLQFVVTRGNKRQTFSTTFSAGHMRSVESALVVLHDLSWRLRVMLMDAMRTG